MTISLLLPEESDIHSDTLSLFLNLTSETVFSTNSEVSSHGRSHMFYSCHDASNSLMKMDAYFCNIKQPKYSKSLRELSVVNCKCVHLITAVQIIFLTFPKLPLPSTMRKLKSDARMTSFFPMLCGTSLSDISGAFFVIDVF